MFVSKVSLKNFRNYKEETVLFSKGLNVIYGNNAQGKTNLLESIYFGAIGKSFKPVSEKELILFGEKFSDISVDYFSGKRDMTNSVRIFTDRKKIVAVNGVNLTKMSELIGKLTVVIFTPEELSLVKEGPSLRRRFLDMSISQIRPNYMRILSGYNKALEQKNKLLKDVKQNPSLLSTLPVWDEQLSGYGARIILYRKAFLEKIMAYAKEFHSEISMEKELLEGQYKASVNFPDDITEEKLKEIIFDNFRKNREKEIALGQSVIGPHRDDIVFYINGNPAKIYGSQGQQRTIVLSLKLAQKELFAYETEEEPVLLLDDITGELDLSRREYLFSKISDSQVFITCTDTDRIQNIDKAGIFRVCDGKIIVEK